MTYFKDPIACLILCICLLVIIRLLTIERKKKLFPIAGLKISDAGSTSEPFKSIYWKNGEMLACLTSGVGQMDIGKISCQIAEDIVRRNFFTLTEVEGTHDFLRRCCLESHRKISENINIQSGGCSIALIFIRNKELFWVSSGDISIYIYEKKMIRLNKRDLYKHKLREKILDGQISEQRVLTNTLKNEITSYLGYENFQQLEGNRHPVLLKNNQKLLVCSREVDEAFSEIEMEKVIKQKHLIETKIANFEKLYQERSRNRELKATLILAEKFKRSFKL